MKKCIVIILAFLMLSVPDVQAVSDDMFSACLINAVTGEVVFEKDSMKPHAMASTTKILTAIIALDESGADDIVTVSRNAAYTEGSSAYTKEGDEYRMLDLLYGLMLNSGNDAAVAIAEHISGSTQAFASLMNEYAYKNIGVKTTKLQNPNGLFEDGHYTTAYDLAMIGAYAMKNDVFCEIVKTKVKGVRPLNRDEEIFYVNHNKLLGRYDGCVGIKTGYTKDSGRCLVSAAERDEMRFIAVTLDDRDDWNTHAELFDYAFEEHYSKTVIEGGSEAREGMVYAGNFVVPTRRGKESNYEVVNHFASNTDVINEGEKVGYAEIFLNGSKIGTVDIISEQEKTEKKTNLLSKLLGLLDEWL